MFFFPLSRCVQNLCSLQQSQITDGNKKNMQVKEYLIGFALKTTINS